MQMLVSKVMSSCCCEFLALALLALPLLPRSVDVGNPSLLRAESGAGSRLHVRSKEAAIPRPHYLESVDSSSLLERTRKVRSSTGQDCLATDPSWQRSNSTSKPGVIFIDLGVEACQSTLMMLGQSIEDSCHYAADRRLAGGWEVCLSQNRKVQYILEDVREKAKDAGFDIFKDQKVVMVEAGPQYVPVMKEVQARYRDLIEYVPYAITAGHDAENSPGLVYDVHQKTIMPEMVMRGKEAEDVKVKPLNLMRLLTSVARKDDYVILKMDVEGAEFDIVPCLVNSPAADLVDIFLLERHDHFAGSKPAELTDAVHSLQRKGVVVRSDWP